MIRDKAERRRKKKRVKMRTFFLSSSTRPRSLSHYIHRIYFSFYCWLRIPPPSPREQNGASNQQRRYRIFPGPTHPYRHHQSGHSRNSELTRQSNSKPWAIRTGTYHCATQTRLAACYLRAYACTHTHTHAYGLVGRSIDRSVSPSISQLIAQFISSHFTVRYPYRWEIGAFLLASRA